MDVREFFGGRVAAELRFWEAPEQNLLCPFHYFGIHDDTDLGDLQWRRVGYDLAALDKAYTGNESWTRIVLKDLGDKVADVAAMRALGFCVVVEHARYLGSQFVAVGIAARGGVGGDPGNGTSRGALNALRCAGNQRSFRRRPLQR
jgi:superfamily II DNA or RNA helicase